MKAQIVRLLVAACLCALPHLLVAQSSHYVVGTEGIKAASLPPPGWYLRDYNQFYYANRFSDGPPDFEAFVYANVPRVIWISEFKILGGYYGADALLPIIYQDVKYRGYSSDNFGIGDLWIEPITLSWHTKQFDFSVGYGFFAPTGDEDEVGLGYWTQMLTAGGTWYADKAKTWAVSALNRYEINLEHDSYTHGNTWTIEGGISKSVTKTVDVGLVGYYQLQTTDDVGDNGRDIRDRVIGLGPEVSAFCPKLGLFTSLRYLFEMGAEDRPEGHTVTLTLTKRF